MTPDPEPTGPTESTNDPSTPPVPAWLSVEVGRSMPPAGFQALPVLQVVPSDAAAATEPGRRSLLAAGMCFEGHAILGSPMTVAGQLQGNLVQADGAQVSVIITETGTVRGDIRAQKISVMGRVDGLLDAGHGEVILHEASEVHGRIRYGRIQVNGADLNATLERVSPPSISA